MKKLRYALRGIVVALSVATATSCTSMVFGPVGQKTFADMPNDLSIPDYCDYKFEKYKFPDGKVADVYVFEEIHDLALWLNLQKDALIPSRRKHYEGEIADLKENKKKFKTNSFDGFIEDYTWRLNVRGPMTPFYQKYSVLLDKYGQKKLLEMAKTDSELFVGSFYKAEDLGILGTVLTENSNAAACYEDASGVYWLRISSAETAVSLRGNKQAQKDHKGEFVYDVVYIPNTLYEKIAPPTPKLTPAKVNPFDPSSVPDSDRSFNPVATKEKGTYYYDANLANDLQWLAVKIACKGVYDMAYTGDFKAKNPTDYYKTSFIKRYLTKNGTSSRGTTLFEGICFDYADFAYKELSTNRKEYSSKISNFYMVGSFKDPNTIVVYRIAKSGEAHNTIINGTPVIVYSQRQIRAHENATFHAWFWVQAKDGTMYWVDPTWTDNSGRPVYGIVRGGQEIELKADQRYCVK